MKKLIVCLFTLLLLVGCTTEAKTKLSDGEEVIFEGPNGYTYTRNDLYGSLKISSEESIEQDLLSKIGELEDVDFESLKTEAQDTVDMYTAMGYESYLISYYGSVDNFIKSYTAAGAIDLLTTKYIEDNFDSSVEEEKPVKMQVSVFYEEESAKQVIDDVNNGKDFDTAVEDAGYAYEATIDIYTDSDETLDYYVKQYLNDNPEKTGISEVITSISNSTDSEGNEVVNYTYYVINIIDRDANNFKDEYIEKIAEEIDEDTVKNYFFEKHDIQFYDQEIYEIMKEEYEVLG